MENTKLIIVESPTKAKTLAKYLDNSFIIRASIGHIRDLPKNNQKAIDIPNGFIPKYEIIKGKEHIIEELKKLAKKTDIIYLATDPDREGEAIAWHLTQVINPENSNQDLNTKFKRIVFHEITKKAIEEALKNPRGIDTNLLKAQEARRVLDRLFGYDLSGLIWKKVRYGLSAGRVQSPALRILVEREREIRAFKPETYWIIKGTFLTENKETIILTCTKEPRDKKEVEIILAAAKKQPWRIIEVKQTEIKRSPRPPFITSTLQQAASTRFGFSPAKTMTIAQRLYEKGFITYMRTDSLNLSKEALSSIYQEIEKTFGKEYLKPRTFTTKSKTAQEAHEAIRPTDIKKKTAGTNKDQKKLYALIRERTLTSQMAEAKILRTTIIANTEGEILIPNFSATGNIIVFPGWLKADPYSRGEEKELPTVTKGDILTLKSIVSEEKQTQPPPRYTEAGLVKELEKREIGRPSTYATIITTLQKRGYVEKIGKTLKPTEIGEIVSTFLEKNFANYISDSFTAEMENDLDEIANGKREYIKTLKDFYEPFSKEIKEKQNTEKLTTLGEAEPHFKCPLCNSTMVIKLGRNGKFLSCKKFPECLGARKIDGTLIEAPKETGENCPQCKTGKLIEREGRFGKFIACSNYPKCKYVKNNENNNIKTIGIKCLLCSQTNNENGEIVERRSRFGVFYSCSNYPKCNFIIKSKPTGNICQLCGSLMMEGTKTIPERCSNKNCSNYNPSKTKE